MAHRRSLGCARDDKKERVAERERTVAKGQGCRRGGGDVDKQPLFARRSKKVTTSQDDDLVVSWRCKKPASSRISIVCQTS
jgi:hypothetical protein